MIFCWTSIPAIVALVQLFTIRTWIRENNTRWTEANGISPETMTAFANWFTGSRVPAAVRMASTSASAPIPPSSQPRGIPVIPIEKAAAKKTIWIVLQ